MFWLGATVSLCYIPGVTGAYIATQWPVLSVLLCFGLLRPGPFTAFHAIGLAFVAYAFAIWPYSPAPYASVFGLWLIVIMGLSVWFGTTLTNTRELYLGLATGAAVSSMLAVLQHFGWHAIPQMAQAPAGIYVNGVQQGTTLALIVVALVSERMWVWALPLLPGIVLAQSRGAWIALAVGLLACGVRRLWVLGAVAVTGTFYLLLPLSGSDAQRLMIWQFAWENLVWFGWGPGIFYTVALPYNGSFSLYPEYAHNDALQFAFEYGIGALLPCVVVCAALWRTDAKEWPIVLAFVVAGCYSMPLFMPVASFLALAAVGRILRSYGVVVGNGCSGRQSFVPWQWFHHAEARGQSFPVAPHHPAEG